MKAGYTHIAILIDKSGSMHGSESDVIGGFNKFVEEQKLLKQEATISMSEFNTEYEKRYEFVDIQEVLPLSNTDYKVGGGTALNDSIAKLIKDTGVRLARKDEKDRPAGVLFVIMTDGEENMSKEFNKTQIKDMIKHQEDVYNWEFIYIGADVDVQKESSSLGVKQGNTVAFEKSMAGFSSMYSNLSDTTIKYRGAH